MRTFHGAAWAFAACAAFLSCSVIASAAPEVAPTTPRNAKAKNNAAVTKHSGGADAKTTVGVTISYALGTAGSWFEVANGRISLREPKTGETNHLIITVKDAQDGRDIPDCQITAYAEAGDASDKGTTVSLIPAWGETSLQYIANLSMSTETTSAVYLRVNVAPPGLARRTLSNKSLFKETIAVEWTDAKISKDLTTTAPASSEVIQTKGSVLTGRHQPVSPTPYPGQKQDSQ